MQTQRLQRGDVVEILYRVWSRRNGVDGLTERWMRAEIIDCDEHARPLARLADGQMTDIRSYMKWRTIGGADRGTTAVAA